ncbi:hypothetical protein V6N12_034942 [Hibiscus sabdariffa]|uniref:STAS domain-containing protein n=1 Tax=Hibiscus sabdariffa TaxID=183260 RepID=A0ABR2BQH5_9ROSI
MSVTVTLTLLFQMHLFSYTPNVALGAISVSAVIGLIDIPTACQIWKMDKFDFIVMLCAFFGVVFISVQGGLIIAAKDSDVREHSRDRYFPRSSPLYVNDENPRFSYPKNRSSYHFANSTYLNERVLRWIEEYEAEDYNRQSSLRFLILEMSAVSGIDTSGTSFFIELKKTVEKKGAKGEVMEKLHSKRKRNLTTQDLNNSSIIKLQF